MGDAEGAAKQAAILQTMESARRYNAWLIDRARPYLGRRVLDAGAGTGTFVELLSQECELVVALENDAELASCLRRRFAGRPEITVVEEDATRLDATRIPGPVDAVVCFNVLEHIPDDLTALVRFRETLAPGGSLLLLVPSHPFLYGSIDRVLAHERRYEKSGLRRLLAQAGFDVEALRHVNPLGALGWLVSGRLVGRTDIPKAPLRAFDVVVPALRLLDRVPLPVGLSLWAMARPGSVP